MFLPTLTKEEANEILSACYSKAINGIPGSKTCVSLADEYLSKYHAPKIAARKFIKAQIAKCATSGFIASLGGLITLPVAIPANVASVMYVQMRMIAVIAVLSGLNPSNDEVQTLVYMCLTGTSIADICKNAGIKMANNSAKAIVKKIPSTVCKAINAKMGYRFITKFGEKGIVNLGKLAPIAGGFFGGGLDLVSTQIIANRALKTFFVD